MIVTPENEHDIRIIRNSRLFDARWYYQKYQDVAQGNGDPIVHYVLWGAKELRNPSPSFSTNSYVLNVKPAELRDRNPFAHFIENRKLEYNVDPGLLKDFSSEIVFSGIQRLDKLPFFSGDHYVRQNGDIKNKLEESSVSVLNHAFCYGFSEGRSVFSRDIVAEILGEAARTTLAVPQPAPANRSRSARSPAVIGVYYNSQGNVFIKELAAGIVDALKATGQQAMLLDETASLSRRPEASIVTAPHEFFHLGRGREFANTEFLKNCIAFNTEQPQTLWFERAMPFILMSRGLIDISCQVAQVFERTGIPAMHFDPVPMPAANRLLPKDVEHPLYRVLPKRAKQQGKPNGPWEDRPLDVAFFGNTSLHRDRFFARSAKALSGYETYIYYRRFTSPIADNERDGILTRLGGHVAGQSKVWLNIHRDEFGFFEWHRIVQQGMLGGSIVVTEPTLPHPLYKPATHFFEESGRHIPNLIDWLLKTQDGRKAAADVREANAGLLGFDTVAANTRRLLHFIDDLWAVKQ